MDDVSVMLPVCVYYDEGFAHTIKYFIYLFIYVTNPLHSHLSSVKVIILTNTVMVHTKRGFIKRVNLKLRAFIQKMFFFQTHSDHLLNCIV